MEIVMVTTRSDFPGGSHVHLLDLSRSLQDQGHEVVVLVGGTGQFTLDLESSGIRYKSLDHLVRPIRPVRDARAFMELRRTISSLGPDIVHAHSSKAGWLARAAAKSLGIPVVFTAHGWAFSEGAGMRAERIYRLAERLAAPLADRIIAVSDYDRRLAIRHGVVPADKIVAIHNGVPSIGAGLRADPARTPPRIVMVARFAAPKDHDALITALSGLLDSEWVVDLVGDGPLRSATEARVIELGLGGRIRFLGARTDVPRILGTAQILALVSRHEGLPLTILEGMRAGLPVIASDVGGVPETITEGITGYLVPRGRIDVLQARLASLISDPLLRTRMGTAGRQRFEQEFQIPGMVRQTLSVYEEAIADAGAGPGRIAGRRLESRVRAASVQNEKWGAVAADVDRVLS